jgi:hypothetical protein
MRKKFQRMKIQLVFILIIVLIGGGIYLYMNRRSIYDFSHLAQQRVDYGEGREFTPLNGEAVAFGVPYVLGADNDELVPVADNETLTLYVSPETSNFAVRDKRNGHVWHSSPPGAIADPIANNFEKGIMRSLFGFRYYDEQNRRFTKWSYQDSAENYQFELESIPNGVRIHYEVGDTSLGIDLCPRFIEMERFQERFVSRLTDASDIRFLSSRAYRASTEREGFMVMPEGFRTNSINIERILRIFDELEYTVEELVYDNEIAEYEMELSLDYFAVQLDIVLHDDTLTFNMPLDKIETSGNEKIFFIEMLKYFGAGASDEDGYIFVPSGSGGLLRFNNGKTNEETYISVVYGVDPLMVSSKPQITTPVRLPVYGIKKENAAVVAWIDKGAALATINADVAGKINDFNIVWPTFLVRDHEMMTMAGGSETDMTIVQQQPYDGDITLKFRFVANEDADYTGMALAYQRALVEEGALTRLAPTANTPFYLDIIGAVEKRKFIVGTPYKAMEPMTTYAQANEIVDLLNGSGVNNIQMRWLGWFNRGINHDVAKKINWTGAIGSRNEMRQLNERLAADEGGLYPGVNLQKTAWTSRRITRSYDINRSPAGYTGYFANYAREMLRIWGPGRFDSDWFMLVHPGVLPFHIDAFIPAYEKINMDNLALNDMGELLSASLYRKDTIDRENSRMIATEQLNRLDGAFGSLMISGGNDYSLGMADHLINVPTQMDRFYILDHEVPFYQIVVHGFIDYTGAAVNTREVQDTQSAFLNMLATGASPYYVWSYQPTRSVEFTAYDILYSTQFSNWFDVAVEQYNTFNGIYKDLRTQRITGHRIVYESARDVSAVTVTEFEDGTRIYVNTTREAYQADGYQIPSMGYYVHKS